MDWKIEFYNEDVEKRIKEWPDAMVPKLIWLLDLIKEIGPDKMSISHVKTMGQGLFKLSAKGHKDTGYALFCVSLPNKTIVILNGFMKSTAKLDPGATDLARSRMTELNYK